ncbi:unnamed protein product [Linum trigynum]|uniref:Uncharacterized protein n=1 Tax=Linum trigynum TaxID=586398 RepID=A0AAV2FE94_9ROSI
MPPFSPPALALAPPPTPLSPKLPDSDGHSPPVSVHPPPTTTTREAPCPPVRHLPQQPHQRRQAAWRVHLMGLHLPSLRVRQGSKPHQLLEESRLHSLDLDFQNPDQMDLAHALDYVHTKTGLT